MRRRLLARLESVASNLKIENFKKTDVDLGKHKPFSVTHPEVAAAWCPFRNRGWGPESFTCMSQVKCWWICGQAADHVFQEDILKRVLSEDTPTKSCPFCAGLKVARTGRLYVYKKESSELHPTKNGLLTPRTVLIESDEQLWWKCSTCRTEWKMSPAERIAKASDNAPSCPLCYLLDQDCILCSAGIYSDSSKQTDKTKKRINCPDCHGSTAPVPMVIISRALVKKALAIRMWREEMSMEAIASELGLTKATIRNWLNETGIRAASKYFGEKKEQALALLHEGEKGLKVAALLQVSPATVYSWSKEVGLSKTKEFLLIKEKALRLFMDGKGEGEIAQILQVSASAISNWRKAAGLQPRHLRGTYSSETKAEAVRLLQAGMSVGRVAEQTRVLRSTVAAWRRAAGFANYKATLDARRATVFTLFQEGCSTKQIAESLKITIATVNSWRRKAGIPVKKNDYSEQKAGALSLFNSGMPAYQISKELSVPMHIIRKWYQEFKNKLKS